MKWIGKVKFVRKINKLKEEKEYQKWTFNPSIERLNIEKSKRLNEVPGLGDFLKRK